MIEVVVEGTGCGPFERVLATEDEVADIIRRLQGESDAQVTVRRQDCNDKLLIAISGNSSFIGLDGEDGVFQYVARRANDPSDGTRFTIGNQPTVIDPQYVMSVGEAANATRDWLTGGRNSAGDWERR